LWILKTGKKQGNNPKLLDIPKKFEVSYENAFVLVIPLAPMGVLAHRLRTLDRSLVPPSTKAEIRSLGLIFDL
jgi:hypothetical protein